MVVQARATDAFAPASRTYLDREALRSAVGGAQIRSSADGCPAASPEFASFRVRGRGQETIFCSSTSFPSIRQCTLIHTLGEDEDVAVAAVSRLRTGVISVPIFFRGLCRRMAVGRLVPSWKLPMQSKSSASLRSILRARVGYDGPLGITGDSTLLFSARRLDSRLFRNIEELDIGDPVLRTSLSIVTPITPTTRSRSS